MSEDIPGDLALETSQSATEQSEVRICAREGCGLPLKPGRVKFCSKACYRAPTSEKPLCLNCGKPVKRIDHKYCNTSCRDAHKWGAPSRCPVCDKKLRDGRMKTCSLECSTTLRYKRPGVREEVLRLTAEGMTRREIGDKLGLSYGQIKGIWERSGHKLTREETDARSRRVLGASPPIPRKARNPKKAAPKKVRVQAYAQRPRPRTVARAQETPKREPLIIHLHEIYIKAAQLDLPRNKRGDLDSLNRAVKREKPDHPGYRLFTPGSKIWAPK